MSEKNANIVHQWLKDFHNKDHSASERIDVLVNILDELEGEAFDRGYEAGYGMGITDAS